MTMDLTVPGDHKESPCPFASRRSQWPVANGKSQQPNERCPLQITNRRLSRNYTLFRQAPTQMRWGNQSCSGLRSKSRCIQKCLVVMRLTRAHGMPRMLRALLEYHSAKPSTHAPAQLTMIEDIIRDTIARLVADNGRALTSDTLPGFIQCVSSVSRSNGHSAIVECLGCHMRLSCGQPVHSAPCLLLRASRRSPIGQGRLQHLIHPVSQDEGHLLTDLLGDLA